ncbi:T-cell immunoglobulin and mucin domain-containing protein 4-like [Trematomus bernacchii]|uniref:T-cell immunoglobulin and mucin domain-containing protein 4-like n=1 Tax=Trematomus bernacchii TaxID=40690 RepID=UPI00146E33D6|nr:T-cell immunoglobulin and mucin domain-containing protein 4-like [Trematomus bernacchii]XP_033987545.1 T-cell immunoglobulin and mucin domain-containing protein 4-like [Trematomus bernacchii]XP_033987546.1 T-cell immunoglobulin and mucin domain-containing protein 4-like [Trematomus bernacchii]XP_033987547.1 T-cell immunoglobulin and mucin domain-containing protein 4-like [Trematomus bernacchii]XP_033987548.1 T-cell immunoglobulin and mucin domain-containing protein 4-like [Trematomus bernacc
MSELNAPFLLIKKAVFFCKETCKQEDILIETTDAKDYQRARYSIDHKQDDFLVTITQLTKSDSGKYRCGSTASSSRNSSKLIEIIVVDAKLDGGPSAEKTIDARTGGNIVVECSFTRFGTRRYFCKEECVGDILVETTIDTYTKKDRYSIRHVKGGFVFVSIEQLNQSDSGWYRCGLDRPDSKDPYQRFRLNVTDASTPTVNQSESSTSSPASPKTTEQSETTTTALTTSTPSLSVPSASSTTTIQSERSTTTPASPKTTKHPEETKALTTSPKTTEQPELTTATALTTSTPSSSVPSASSTTTIQSERSTTTPASPKTTKHPEETKALTTSPKTTEQPESTTATGVILYLSLTLVVLVIVSSLSVLVFCRKRTCKAKSEEPEPHEETQCASAPEAEDDPSQHAYSEIKFVSVGSSQSGFHGDAECVIYSVPRVEASSDEPPLCSTVNNPQ